MAGRGRPAKRNAALSEDEASDGEPQPVASWPKSESADDDEPVSEGVPPANGDDDEGDEVDEDEDERGLDEDEYDTRVWPAPRSRVLTACRFIVEAIRKHMVDEDVRRQHMPPAPLVLTAPGILEVPRQVGGLGEEVGPDLGARRQPDVSAANSVAPAGIV